MPASVNALSMNMGQIRAEVEAYLMNTSADINSLSWSQQELNDYINEGVLYTQQVTLWFEQFDNVVCTGSDGILGTGTAVSTYTAPNTVYQFTRLTWDRSFLPQTNEYELDRDDPSWRMAPPNNPFRFYFPQFGQQAQIVPYPTPGISGLQYSPFNRETGTVQNFLLPDGVTADPSYSFNQEFGCIIGVADTNGSIIMFQPDIITDPFIASKGNITTAAFPDFGELQIYTTDEQNIGLAFARIPDTMVVDADTPQLPVVCHYGLVFYTLMKCFVREGEFQDLQEADSWFSAYADWMESVLENKARWWSTRVRSLEPFEEGSLFAQRLNAIGFPLQLDLKPSYGT